VFFIPQLQQAMTKPSMGAFSTARLLNKTARLRIADFGLRIEK
jgi:hypothetical protein